MIKSNKNVILRATCPWLDLNVLKEVITLNSDPEKLVRASEKSQNIFIAHLTRIRIMEQLLSTDGKTHDTNCVIFI